MFRFECNKSEEPPLPRPSRIALYMDSPLLQYGFKEFTQFILEISKCRESRTVCHNTLIYDDRRSLIVGIAEKVPKQLVH